MASPAPSYIQLARTELAYLDGGDPAGIPVLFLHGFPDDAHTWDAVVTLLEQERFRCLRPWQRGFGGSRTTDENAASGQVAALGRDVLEFADGLGIDRFFLVGHDCGSRAAHAVAALAPERVLGMVALATGYGEGSPSEEDRLRQEQAFWYQWFFQTPHGRQRFSRDPVAFSEYLWRVWSPNWRFTAEEFRAAARSFDNPQFVSTVLHYYNSRWKSAPGNATYLAEQEILDRPPRITVPAVFACGLADACNLPEFSRGNESFYSNSYLRMEIPGVGHFVQRERPDIVAQVTARLVRETMRLS